MTGKAEFNGTSIVDVTDPAQPKYLKHIPGAGGASTRPAARRWCASATARPAEGRPNKVYMLRTFGGEAHEIWNVTDPANPVLLTGSSGLKDTHKNWWECDTGIALPGLRRARTGARGA
jgi:hypothetical protein